MKRKESNLINVGRIGAPYGVKGWVKLHSYTQPQDNIFGYTPWWIKTRFGVKSVELADYKQHGQGLIVNFDGISDRDQAAELNNVSVAVEKDQMPTLDTGDYYWHQLVGLDVLAENEGQTFRLGQVKSLLETGANDVLVVEPSDHSIDDRERLIPYVPERYVVSVCLDSAELRVLWDPEY